MTINCRKSHFSARVEPVVCSGGPPDHPVGFVVGVSAALGTVTPYATRHLS
jgi:hypothetical protein